MRSQQVNPGYAPGAGWRRALAAAVAARRVGGLTPLLPCNTKEKKRTAGWDQPDPLSQRPGGVGHQTEATATGAASCRVRSLRAGGGVHHPERRDVVGWP